MLPRHACPSGSPPQPRPGSARHKLIAVRIPITATAPARSFRADVVPAGEEPEQRVRAVVQQVEQAQLHRGALDQP